MRGSIVKRSKESGTSIFMTLFVGMLRTPAEPNDLVLALRHYRKQQEAVQEQFGGRSTRGPRCSQGQMGQ